jgi:hypothetical protein
MNAVIDRYSVADPDPQDPLVVRPPRSGSFLFS